MKTFRLVGRLQGEGVRLHAAGAEVIGEAANSEDERVVAELALWSDLPPLVVVGGRHTHHAPPAVDADEAAEAKREAVPVRLRQVVDLVRAQVHAARSDLVQQRLPEVRAALVDQRDMGLLAPAQSVAEPGDQLQPAGASADNDDAMRLFRHALGPAS